SQIEEIEELLDDALGIGWGVGFGVEFDTENLLRMDSITQVATIKDAVAAGVMSPNEGRGKLDLKPVAGGESPYLQQQNYSLAALAKRDAQDDPFATSTPTPPTQPDQMPPPADATPDDPAVAAKDLAALFGKALLDVHHAPR